MMHEVPVEKRHTTDTDTRVIAEIHKTTGKLICSSTNIWNGRNILAIKDSSWSIVSVYKQSNRRNSSMMCLCTSDQPL